MRRDGNGAIDLDVQLLVKLKPKSEHIPKAKTKSKTGGSYFI